MEDIFIAALERMLALERAMAWLDQLVVSPPTWPAVADTPGEKKQVQAAVIQERNQSQTTVIRERSQSQITKATEAVMVPTVLTPLAMTSFQKEQTNQAANTYQRFAQVAKPIQTSYNQWGGETLYQHTPHSMESQQSQQVWAKTVYPTTTQTLDAPTRLTQQTQPLSQTKETTVTVSPTVHLQATVYEQADLEALITKLNHLLEEEIAISAERAYT